MRLHRFYTKNELKVGGSIIVNDKNVVHQWKKVFRLKTTDKVTLFDGSGFDFTASISGMRDGEAILEIEEKKSSRFIPERENHFFVSITKKDNFEVVLEKCTEIGVTEFTPVISERTEKKNINETRAEIILKEASEQSGRGNVPKLNGAINFKDVVDLYGKDLVLLHTENVNEKKEINSFSKFLVGPEGGFSQKEINYARERGVQTINLGNQVLRAETAAISLASLLILK